VKKGTLDAGNVFQTICHGFNVTPDACYPDYDETIGARRQPASEGISKSTLIVIILLAVAINVLLIYCYRRYTRREMKEEMQLQISSMVSQYFALNDTSKGGKTTIVPTESLQ